MSASNPRAIPPRFGGYDHPRRDAGDDAHGSIPESSRPFASAKTTWSIPQTSWSSCRRGKPSSNPAPNLGYTLATLLSVFDYYQPVSTCIICHVQQCTKPAPVAALIDYLADS